MYYNMLQWNGIEEQMDRQMDRQIDGQMEEKMGGWIDKQMGR